MKVITVDGIAIVAGLDWEQFQADQGESKARRKVLSHRKGVHYGTQVENGILRALGLVQPVHKKMPKEPSGAALLALANQAYQDRRADRAEPGSQSAEETNWIVVENLGQDQYWVAVVYDGLPLPGSDAITSRSEAIEIVELMLDTSSAYMVHSPDLDIRNEMSVKAQVTEKGFKSLVQGENIKSSKAALRQVAGLSSKVVLTVILLLVALTLGLGYQQLAKKRAAAAAAAEAANRRAQEERLGAQTRAEYAEQVRAAILKALAEGKRAVEQRLGGPPPGVLVRQWSRVVTGLPFNWAGWGFSGIECIWEGAASSCQIHLVRGPYGINRLLAEVRPDAVVHGDRADYSVRLPEAPNRPARWDRIQSTTAFSVGLISDLQLLNGTGVTYTNEDSKEIQQAVKLPPPPKSLFKGTEPPIKVDPVKMGVAAGKMTFSGDGLWQLEGVARLSTHPALSLMSLRFTQVGEGRGNGWTWSAEFQYLVRTAPRPTLPTVALPDNVLISVDLPAEFSVPSAPNVSPAVPPPPPATPPGK